MILELNKNCFEGLENGTHTLKVRFKDGHAESNFEVKDKISFTIIDTVFTATADMTWGDWITSYNIGTSGNNILWVNPENQGLYLNCSNYPTWSQYNQGALLGDEIDAFYDSNDVRQTLNTPIVNGALYGRSSDSPT
jgi:hypothetical protein